jgi:hydroxymethylpyrimidine/phosphomethylpyrimidine kinase
MMVSISGPANEEYFTELLPHTTILTPNIPAALLLAKLGGRDFGPIESLTYNKRIELATFLAAKVPWVLLKGDAVPIEREGIEIVIDILTNSKGETLEFISEKSSSRGMTGQGGTLACISFDVLN